MPDEYKRFLTGREQDYQLLIENARHYVENSQHNNPKNIWLYSQPYDRLPGHTQYFRLMYFALNLLQAMDIPHPARILEIGSGSGWLTEILVGLGVNVDAVEPSEDFNRLARQRIDAAFRQLDPFEPVPRPHFHTTTLEECEFPDETFDGIIFFASLHHIVDEVKGLEKCFRMLKPGGRLGVSGEEAWIPDNADQMKIYETEMATYGTLENPFTKTYLDDLLKQIGFAPILRYHQINGWFPTMMENQTILQASQIPAVFSNSLVAYKSIGDYPTTDSPDMPTAAKIEILDFSFSREQTLLRLHLKLTNSGETSWLHQPKEAGWVTVALFQGELGTPSFRESAYRAFLPGTIIPGASCELRLNYSLPDDAYQGDWLVDLVNEGYFWFSMRGSQPGIIRLGTA